MSSDALYREVTEQHGAALGRLAAAYERVPERREGLLRKLHASIWKSLEFFDQRSALSTWVYRVAHNVGAAHLTEREGVRFEARDGPAEPGPLLPRALGLLHEMPPLERQVISLYLEGMDALVISQITGLQPTDVALRLHQSKTALIHRVSPALDEATLRAQWKDARAPLPTAFTISELRESGLDATGRSTKDFLEQRLREIRSDGRFRFLGSVALIPLLLLLCQPAALHSRWALLGVLALIGGVMVVLLREWLAIAAASRALMELRPPEQGGLSPERSTVLGLLLIAGTVVVSASAYKFSGGPGMREVRSKQGVENTLTRCLDPKQAASPECAGVLRAQGPTTAALPGQAPGCRQKWTALAAREPPTPAIEDLSTADAPESSEGKVDVRSFLKSGKSARAALFRQQREKQQALTESMLFDGVSLAEECPGDLIVPAALLKKDLVNEVIESTRRACLAAPSSDVCGAYARLACQGQSAEWRTRNEAFLTFMSVRERLSAEAQAPWECVDSPLVGLLQALSVSTPAGVSLRRFETHESTAKLIGSAPGQAEVTELAGSLRDLVSTPSALGRVVHRSADGSAGVKLLGRGDELELAPTEMKVLFAHVEVKAITESDFELELELNRDALPAGKEWAARYAPDVIAEHYVAVVRDAPENAEAWLALAYAHKARSKPEEAIVAFKRYLELRPESPTRKQLEDQIYFLGGQ